MPAGTPTPKGFRSPLGSALPDVPADIFKLADDVDTYLANSYHLVNTLVNRPAASAALNGVRFYATDAEVGYQCVAAAWVRITAVPDGIQAGILTGGIPTRQGANTVRITAGTGWVPDANGALQYVTWNQTDVNVPNAASTRADLITLSSDGAINRSAGADTAGQNHWNAPAPGTNAIRLATAVSTPTGIATPSTATTGVMDRRKRAKGFIAWGTLGSSGDLGFAEPAAADFRRIELSGLCAVEVSLGIESQGTTDVNDTGWARARLRANVNSGGNATILEVGHHSKNQWPAHTSNQRVSDVNTLGLGGGSILIRPQMDFDNSSHTGSCWWHLRELVGITQVADSNGSV